MKVDVKIPFVSLENFCEEKGIPAILEECGSKSEVDVCYAKMTTDPKTLPLEILESVGYGKPTTKDTSQGWAWVVSDTKDDDTSLLLVIEVNVPPYTPIRIMPEIFDEFDPAIRKVMDTFLNAKTEEETDKALERYKAILDAKATCLNIKI